MEATTQASEPRVFDTYALVFAISMALLVPVLFVIERFDYIPYEPGFLLLVTSPFVLGIVLTLLTDSSEPWKRRWLRVLVLTPLALFGGITILFVAEMAIVLPVSLILVPENFDVLTPFFAASLALVAAPMVVALARRVRGPYTVSTVIQVVALVATLAIVGWTLVMTFQEGRVLGTFLRHDLLDYFSGAQTWFLPSIGLAAGIWRRLGLV